MATYTHEPPGTLFTKTRTLLRADSRALHTLANDSGLPFYWLRKLKADEIRDPSVNRIQRLYEFLTASTIPIQ